eukprot:TRINITY_DN46747_c0_g1_i1.p1 TRINITY_DN46747_c0_g1~~TRINITY_DN46747_c0_g1_i1.p1  ORF type:complete len:600 (-),score=88.47 TRINITY_DN46747_c0_g1_i1:51-1778(-)
MAMMTTHVTGGTLTLPPGGQPAQRVGLRPIAAPTQVTRAVSVLAPTTPFSPYATGTPTSAGSPVRPGSPVGGVRSHSPPVHALVSSARYHNITPGSYVHAAPHAVMLGAPVAAPVASTTTAKQNGQEAEKAKPTSALQAKSKSFAPITVSTVPGVTNGTTVAYTTNGGHRVGYPHAVSMHPMAFVSLPPTVVAATPQSRTRAYTGAPRPPPESRFWTPLEFDLFNMSGGAYNPTQMARHRRVRAPHGQHGTGVQMEVKGRVSIVAPSMATRQHYHENLWRCFEAQTWPDKELIVVETYEDATPSKFLQQKAKLDPRIVHVVMHRAKGTDFTVGLKRNMTLHIASGEFVVNFDDDDLYSPQYVSTLVGHMQQKGLVGITLSAWHNYYVGRGVCTFSDPSGWGEWVSDAKELENVLYGYGFSYVHRRAPSLAHPYPNVGFAEDAPFFLKLRELYGDPKVLLWKDNAGLCMHIMHRANTAQVLGTRTVSAQDLAQLKVCDLKPFQTMIDNDFFRFSPWRPAIRPPAASVVIPIEDIDDESGVKPRLRGASMCEDANGSVSVEEPPQRPRADTYRNFHF